MRLFPSRASNQSILNILFFQIEKYYLGSVSILIKHDELIRSVAGTIEKELGVNCMVMQKDGLILYKNRSGTDRT